MPEERGQRQAFQFYGRRKGRRLRKSRLSLFETLLPRLTIGLPTEGTLDPARLFDRAVAAISSSSRRKSSNQSRRRGTLGPRARLRKQRDPGCTDGNGSICNRAPLRARPQKPRRHEARPPHVGRILLEILACRRACGRNADGALLSVDCGIRSRPACAFRHVATRYTIVFGTSAMTPRPPDMSPYSVQ